MKKIKVLYPMCGFYPIFTGHGIFLRRLLQQLNKLGIEGNILTDSLGGKYPSIEEMDNFRIYRIDIPFRNPSIKNYLKRFINTFVWMKRHRELYDIIHLNDWAPNFIFASLLAKMLWNKSVIMEMSLMGSDDPLTVFSKKNSENKKGMLKRHIVLKKLSSYIDHYIPLSEPIKQSSLKSGIPSHKITKIGQMVDIEKYKPVEDQDKLKLREKLDLPGNSFIIAFVGSIIYRKGVDILIESFEKVVKFTREIDILLVLIGLDKKDYVLNDNDIAFVERVKKTISESEHIKDRVLFTGLIDNVDEYLKASDLFVFPSRREGFGGAIIEAAACELACIVSPLDEISKHDIFKGENEGVISELNSDSFADAMLSLVNNEEKRKLLGKNARKRVCQDFSYDVITNKYIELYKSLCSNKKSRV